MKPKRIVILLVLLTNIVCSAQTLTAMRDSVRDSYNFWLFEPQTIDSPADSIPTDSASLPLNLKPLIVFLHGASLSGSDLNRVRQYGVINAIERGEDLDAFVIAPQTNNGWNSGKIWQIVEWGIARYPIDTNRIYVIGMSMGGYGTINLANTYADKIAAAMALCGGGTMKTYERLCKMPLWIMHGTADKAVPVSASDKVVADMVAHGDTSRLIYTRFPGQNHGFLARVFYMTKTYDWLFRHSLQDSARVVCRDYDIKVADFSGVYSHYNNKHPHIKIINGISAAYSKPLTYTASVSNSSTTQTADNQASADMYVVKKGDTLYAIARAHQTTVKALCSLNGISENSILRIGQKLKTK